MSTTWLRRLTRMARFRLAAVLMVVLVALAVVPGAVVSLSPTDVAPTDCSVRANDGSFQDRLPPSSAHWFGTDAQGCEVFAQVVWGSRTSLFIGVGSGSLIAVIGTGLGVLAAIRGGWVDALIRRTCDVTLGIPLVVGAILLLSMLAGEQRSPTEIMIVLALLGWPGTARIARGAARTVLVQQYIEAARAAGAGDVHVIVRHVLPNVVPSVAAYTSLGVGLLIAAESTLTYLGIGLQVPSVSWGLMIEDAQRSYATSPYLIVFPSIMLVTTVAAFVLLGDAVRDAVDAHVEVAV